MGFIIAFIVFLFAAGSIVVPIILIYSRRQAREQKNYERGLKMVPMLIHLPPISEDTDAQGRDVRDLVDENVSKAQVIYNIIASTYEKGFKRKIYGQQHFAFEILSAKGFVYFYATVPIGLVEVVRQAVVSAYPAARLEEAEEHNIFNVAGKSAATTGGELVLKESFAYPISTYVDLKRDAMQAMLNSLANLGKEDGAAIQILMRPADPTWRKTAHAVATSKRKGEKDGGVGAKVFNGAREIGTALVKPPEGSSDKPDLSDHEQSVLNAIDDKTRYPAFEVVIRLVASSNIITRSQTIMSNMVAAFSLFDSPGKNGFKFEPSKDVDELETSYILKFFPQDSNKMILNSVELATIFHFPDQRNIPTTQLERQDSKQVDGPRNMPDEGLLLGYNVFRGVKKPIRLAIGDRQRHMYVVGQTGTGKSTFLENLALQDMLSGNGFAFVDPHGDTAEKLLSMVPKERTEDVIYFCPAEMDHPMGLNIFEFDNPDQKDFLIQESINMLYKLYDPQHQGIMGPRYEHLFRNAALTVMADPAGGTFIDLPKLFRDPQYVKQKLVHVTDANVREFWEKEMPQSQRSNEFGEVVSWFVSKFGAFVSNEMMRNIIGQTKSSFNLREIMDNKKILLVNLSKGRTGDLNSKLLGIIFVMKFQAAAMSRANIPEKDRVDFSLYVDEFQNFSTDSFATIMSEARKYHLNLIVANQFTTQLTEEIRDAVFGNMGTIVAFRVGQNDVDSLTRYFQPIFDADDLLRVPNYNTITRTLTGGVPTQSFSMATLPPLGEPNVKLSAALKQLSAAKFGKPKAVVEKEIFARIATLDSGAPGGFGAAAPAGGAGAWGARPGAPAGAGGFGGRPAQGMPPQPGMYNPAAPQGSMGQAPPRSGNGSFLDEWMAKRPGPVAGPNGAAPGSSFAPNRFGASPTAPPSSMAGPAPVNPGFYQGGPQPNGAPAAMGNQFGSPMPPQAAAPSPADAQLIRPQPKPVEPPMPEAATSQSANVTTEAPESKDEHPSIISKHQQSMSKAGESSDQPAKKKKRRKKKSKSPSEGGSSSSLEEGGRASFGQADLPNAEPDENDISNTSLDGLPTNNGPEHGSDNDDEDDDDDNETTAKPQADAAHHKKVLQPISGDLAINPHVKASDLADAAGPMPSMNNPMNSPMNNFPPMPQQQPNMPYSPGGGFGNSPQYGQPPMPPASFGGQYGPQQPQQPPQQAWQQPWQPQPWQQGPQQPMAPQQGQFGPQPPMAPAPQPQQPQPAAGQQSRVPHPVEDEFAHGDTLIIDQNGNMVTTHNDPS